MSYLPYGRGAPGGWLASGFASVAIHGGVIAVMGMGLSEWFVDTPQPPARPEFQITLEQLETDTLAGLVERLGQATGLDDAEEMQNMDPEGALAPDDSFDAAAVPAPEDIEETSPDALEPEQPAPPPDVPAAEDVLPDGPEDIASTPAEDLAALPPDADALEAPVPPALSPDSQNPDSLPPQTLPPQEPIPDAPELAETVQAPLPDLPATPASDSLEALDIPLVEDGISATETLPPEPLDALPALSGTAPQATSDTPLQTPPGELTGAEPLDALAAVPPDVPALTPDTPSARIPAAEDDPLIVGDGILQVGSTVLAPVVSEALPPVVTGDATAVAPPEPDQLAALAPVDPAGPTGAELPAVQTPGETLPATPQLPESQLPESQLPEPRAIAPQVIAPQVAAPAALPPQPPETLEASEPADGEAITATAVTAAPSAAQTPRITRKPRAPPTERDLAVADLIQRVRARTQDNCVIALPLRDGDDGIGLSMMAAEDGAMSAFAREVLVRPEDAEIRQTRTLVDTRQCALLSFVARNRDYPATRIGMRLDSNEIASGNRLSGVARGTAGRNLRLYVVDNNGVVSGATRFTMTSGPIVRFDIPMVRRGPLRDTSQLLLALASQEPLEVLDAREGQLVADFLADLSNELSRNAAIAIVPFQVR